MAATKPRHARGCAQLPGFRLLCTRDFERPLETGFGFCGIRLWRHQGDFAGDAMKLGLVPFFLGDFRRRHRFADGPRADIFIPALATRSGLMAPAR